VIKGSAETLTRTLGASNALAAELAGYISSEVNKLNALVSRFLDFARPLDLDLRSQELPALIDEALKSVRDRFPGDRVEVEREYAPDLPKAPVDAALCEQVFTNLTQNAYEAMAGDGKLRIKVAAANANGRRGVEIDFQDTGPGVTEGLGEQIFNPFFTTKKDGVGLGLSIVSKIVDQHHGWIRVSSEPGKGACFRVFLPVE